MHAVKHCTHYFLWLCYQICDSSFTFFFFLFFFCLFLFVCFLFLCWRIEKVQCQQLTLQAIPSYTRICSGAPVPLSDCFDRREWLICYFRATRGSKKHCVLQQEKKKKSGWCFAYLVFHLLGIICLNGFLFYSQTDISLAYIHSKGVSSTNILLLPCDCTNL